MRTIPSSLFPLLLTLLFRASLPPTQTSTQADEISQPGAGGLTIHVAPGGDGHWSGALSHPNAARTDGPLATLKGARDRIRTLRHEQKIGFGPITVMIAAGTYPVSGPVVYELADGGTAAAPVIYQAEPGAWPIFDGGRAITGFSRRPDGLWTAKVPDVAAGRWTFEQLFVNGRRATRARTPNEFNYYMLKRVTQGIDPATGQTVPMEKRAFIARGEDLEPLKGLSPEQLHDVNVVVFHSWEVSRHRIASVDHKTGMVILTGPAPWAFFAWGPNQRYYFENVPNTFDRPGEWFLDGLNHRGRAGHDRLRHQADQGRYQDLSPGSRTAECRRFRRQGQAPDHPDRFLVQLHQPRRRFAGNRPGLTDRRLDAHQSHRQHGSSWLLVASS